GAGIDLDELLVIGKFTEWSGYSNFLSHNHTFAVERVSASSNNSNSRSRGLISRVRPTWLATASSVFKPLPVTQSTTESLAGIRPAAISFLATPTVTPPGVSAKIPSHRASR